MRALLSALALLLLAALAPAQGVTHQKLNPGDDVQAAIDRAAEPSLIEFVPGVYWHNRPLVLHKDRMTLKGAGKSLTQLRIGPPGCDGLLTMRRIPLKGDERVGLRGVLDGTCDNLWGTYLPDRRRIVGVVGGGAAQRFAGYLKRDQWQTVNALTIDVAARFRRNYGDTAQWFGFDEFQHKPEPWVVTNNAHVGVFTMAIACADGTHRTLTVPCGTLLVPVKRLTIQLDLDAGKAWAWVDGQKTTAIMQTTVLVNGFPVGLELPWAGTRFRANDNAEFGVRGTPHDHDLLGLKWTPALVYDGAQESRVRLDGQPASDRISYYHRQNDCWCLDGEPLSDLRQLSAHAGYAYEILYLLEEAHYSPWSGTSGITIQDLSVLGNAAGGQGLAIGNTLHLTLERVAVNQGWSRGLAFLKTAVCYPVRVRDCDFDGNDCSLALTGTTAYMNGLTLGYGGRWYVYMAGTGGTMTDVFCNSPDGGLMRNYGLFRNSDDNATFTMTNFGVDDEGAGVKSVEAGFLVRATAGGSLDFVYQHTRVHMPRPTLPVFRLEAGANTRPCRLMTQGVTIDQGSAVADVRSAKWAVGQVSDFNPGRPWRTPGSVPEVAPAPDPGPTPSRSPRPRVPRPPR